LESLTLPGELIIAPAGFGPPRRPWHATPDERPRRPVEGYGRERSSDGCRGPAALANKPGVAGVGPPPTVELVPTLPGPTNVVLVAVPLACHSQQS
jgi:hypothetical protein